MGTWCTEGVARAARNRAARHEKAYQAGKRKKLEVEIERLRRELADAHLALRVSSGAMHGLSDEQKQSVVRARRAAHGEPVATPPDTQSGE